MCGIFGGRVVETAFFVVGGGGGSQARRLSNAASVLAYSNRVCGVHTILRIVRNPSNIFWEILRSLYLCLMLSSNTDNNDGMVRSISTCISNSRVGGRGLSNPGCLPQASEPQDQPRFKSDEHSLPTHSGSSNVDQ